jgi:hypothetical protein
MHSREDGDGQKSILRFWSIYTFSATLIVRNIVTFVLPSVCLDDNYACMYVYMYVCTLRLSLNGWTEFIHIRHSKVSSS